MRSNMFAKSTAPPRIFYVKNYIETEGKKWKKGQKSL